MTAIGKRNLGGNANLNIRMFILLAVSIGIPCIILILLGQVLNFASAWVYVVIVLVAVLIQFLIGPALISTAMRVKIVSEAEEPELHSVVEELAKAANIPKPKVGLSMIAEANAFAYGLTRWDSRICITPTLKGVLNREEMRAVLGHEIAHLRNWDMTIISTLSAIPMLIYNLAYSAMDYGEGIAAGLLGIMLMGVYFLSYPIQLLVLYGSRIREYYADRGSVRLGNEAHYLASALYKTSLWADSESDLQRIKAARAFFISDPSLTGEKVQRRLAQIGEIDADELTKWRQKQVKIGFGDTVAEFFGSHPNILKRIKALSEM